MSVSNSRPPQGANAEISPRCYASDESKDNPKESSLKEVSKTSARASIQGSTAVLSYAAKGGIVSTSKDPVTISILSAGVDELAKSAKQVSEKSCDSLIDSGSSEAVVDKIKGSASSVASQFAKLFKQ